MKHELFKSRRIVTNKPLVCPVCGGDCDGATGTNPNGPKDGDISICVICATS